jgi:alpha amylase-like protein
MPPWPAAPRLYEINTRVWLAELSARLGQPLTLADVPEADVAAIARLGFDAVWLMGVWTSGEAPVAEARRPDLLREWQRALADVENEDVIGSPYAISDYRVAERLGGDAALATLRERLARHGLRLMLDFVPNHTACDHPLVTSRPEVFVRGTEEDLARDRASFFRTAAGAVIAHGRDPYFPAWSDTAQIDYAHAPGRAAMLEILLRIGERADGVRCDMAMLLLPDVIERVWGRHLGAEWIRESFWPGAIAEVRARHPDFLFLAEAYWGLETRLQAEGFDFTYDKSLYDALRAGHAGEVRGHLARPLATQRRCARFTENHDEPRATEAFGPRTRAAAVLTYLGPGLKLFHEGQLEGRRIKVPVQLGRRPHEDEDRAARTFYDRLLQVLREPCFLEGGFMRIEVSSAGPGDVTHEAFVAFLRQAPCHADAELGWLVVSNLGDRRAYGRIRLPLPFEDGRTYRFDDRLNGASYDRAGAELRGAGLFVALDPGASHAFSIVPALNP